MTRVGGRNQLRTEGLVEGDEPGMIRLFGGMSPNQGRLPSRCSAVRPSSEYLLSEDVGVPSVLGQFAEDLHEESPDRPGTAARHLRRTEAAP